MVKGRWQDACFVTVENGNIEGAIRQLKKRFSAAGIYKLLKLRSDHPSRAARRKEKARKAAARRPRGPH
jgi:ribosomal protein S21